MTRQVKLVEGVRIGKVDRAGGVQVARGAGWLYVGRGNGSVLGNPFVVGKDGTHAEVVQKFRRWLWARIQQRDERVIAELRKVWLTGKIACWCDSHQPCHAEVIARAAKWLNARKAA